jgi:hypothetical protein
MSAAKQPNKARIVEFAKALDLFLAQLDAIDNATVDEGEAEPSWWLSLMRVRRESFRAREYLETIHRVKRQ